MKYFGNMEDRNKINHGYTGRKVRVSDEASVPNTYV